LPAVAAVIGVTALVLPLAAASLPASKPPAASRDRHRVERPPAALAASRTLEPPPAAAGGGISDASQSFALSVAAAPSTVVLGVTAPSVGRREPVLVVATVTSLVPPTGTVTFSAGGSVLPECRRVPVSSSPPHVASCLVAPGGHRSQVIVGSYSGSLSVAPSVSQPLTVTFDIGRPPSG